MAVVAHTESTKRLPVGDRVMQTYRTSVLGAASATEWIATGLSFIEAVVGYTILGDTTGLATAVFEKNAQGTGVAGGTNPGDLGIEVETGIDDIEVTVIGRP